MQRVHCASLHGAGRGHQRLAGDLTAEDALPVVVGRATPEHVDLDDFQVEKSHHIVQRRLHSPIMPAECWRRRPRGLPAAIA